MKVLITGGAGFIGAHVGQALQSRGDRVIVLDDLNDYYDPQLKRARLIHLYRPAPPVVEVDVADGERTAAAVREAKPDVVLHFAAWAGVRPSREHADLFTATNVLGTVNVFEACRRVGVPRVLFASSSSVYGFNAPVPSPESSAGEHQTSGYGVSKRAGELYARLYHKLDGLQITCLRFFTVYGPWGRPDMAMWKFTERVVRDIPLSLHVRSAGGQEVRRDFTEIRDVVRGILAALDQPRPFSIVNIGAASPVTLREFVSAIEGATGKRARVEERVLPSEEAVETGADLAQARALLGFSPTVSVREGAQAFAAWYATEYQTLFPRGLAPSRFWT